ncbi:class I SAM-dependent methyltransferase [Candidatus Kaiserbacteria bacterium]|nr:class I SAM-dependent methyltransferase [Candidatus Kaiserbacteria bacterium]
METIKFLRLLKVRGSKKLLHLLYFPLWLLFKLRNLGFTHAEKDTEEDPRVSKERSIRKLLERIPGGKFLEVGIGEFPHFERLKLINEHSISYVGCDFKSVCESHEEELAIKGFDTKNISFAMNSTGTYSWTLFEMLQKGEQFDVIYVDGHHTFYIDLPAMMLADKLLKPGGYLLLDDIPWSLSFLKANMMRSLSQWYFYRTMYNFSDYTKEQQSLPHIKMIAEELLIKRSGYKKDENLSLPHWWVLRK